MKRLIVTSMLGLVFLIISSVPVPAEQATGAARLHATDGSGIQGRMVFLDTGSPQTGLMVSGTATGLDPTQTYFSLIYDVGALPGGPAACVPAGNPPLTGTQMGVGFWLVGADGTGTLFAVKTGDSYVSLGSIGAVSIRIVLGLPPAGFALQACGQVHQGP